MSKKNVFKTLPSYLKNGFEDIFEDFNEAQNKYFQ